MGRQISTGVIISADNLTTSRASTHAQVYVSPTDEMAACQFDKLVDQNRDYAIFVARELTGYKRSPG